MAKPPRSMAEKPASAPDSLPIGVRAPATMTEPGIGTSGRTNWVGTVYGVPVGTAQAGPSIVPGMPRTVRAYCITTEAVAREKERVGGDTDEMDVSNVIELDKLELRDVGPDDVHLRILAVSGEHNVDHAALADTVNIAEARGGRIYPGNSAVGEVLEVGRAGHRLQARATSCSPTATASPTSSASRCASGPTTSPSRSAGTPRRPWSATGS